MEHYTHIQQDNARKHFLPYSLEDYHTLHTHCLLHIENQRDMLCNHLLKCFLPTKFLC